MNTGHNGEHRSYPANKLFPKEYPHTYPKQRTFLKRVHNRRARRYNNRKLVIVYFITEERLQTLI